MFHLFLCMIGIQNFLAKLVFLSVRAKGLATFFDFYHIFGKDISLIYQIVVTLQKYERKYQI